MKKPGLAILLGAAPKGKAPPAPESDAEMEDGPSDEEVAAFSELSAAMKSGDSATGAMALKNFLKECGY